MKSKYHFLAILLCLLDVNNVGATTYYIDFAAGDDTKDGLTQGTAWKTLPGTLNSSCSLAAQPCYLNATWGPFNTGGNMPDNTMFHIKAGTTYAYPIGGSIFMSDYYAGFNTNIGFYADNTWGTGSTATLDFNHITNSHLGSIFIQRSGIHMTNLVFWNAPWDSVFCKEFGNGGKTGNYTFDHCTSTNHGLGIAYLSDYSTGSSEAGFNIHDATNVLFESCTAESTNMLNGFIVGDVHHNPTNIIFSNCQAYDHYGEPGGLGGGHDDLGIGFKAIYAIVYYTNCTSINNQKGFDLGSHGDGAEMRYTVLNCVARGNTGWGINMVGQGASSSGPAPGVSYPTNSYNYQANCLIVSNGVAGTRAYGSCQVLHLTGNLYDGNGWNTNAAGATAGSQISFNPDDLDGTGPTLCHMYNCAFVNGKNGYTYIDIVDYIHSNIFTIDFDFNSYNQSSAEQFAVWDQNGQGPVTANFAYGANGPGHTSGNWYNFYQSSSVNQEVRPGGTGHFNNDAHSKGTGASDTTAPPINPTTYIPTNSFNGLNLSGQSWYVASVMGRDRLGNARTSWTIGPFEFSSGPIIPIRPAKTNGRHGFGSRSQ